MMRTTTSSCLLICCFSLAAYGQGIITTLAGKDFAFTGDGQPAVSAPLGGIPGVASDSQGNIYFTDSENSLVLKEGPDGVLHVLAGNGIPGYSGDGGPATNASLAAPIAIALDGAGNVYFAEKLSRRIRKVSLSGIISTIAGSGLPDTSGDGGPAIAAGIGEGIYGMAFDGAGNLYFAQRDEEVIRKVDTKGIISTISGTAGNPGFSGDGGPASKATMLGPTGIAFDRNGNLLFSDAGNFRIRSIAPDGTIATVAGGGFFPSDGIPASTALFLPFGLAADASGNIYIGDYLTARIRVVNASGIVSTVGGSGLRGFSGDGGSALTASLSIPFGLAVNGDGDVYFADFASSRVRKISADGKISTVAGNGQYAPSPDGAGISTSLRSPWGIAAAPDGSVLVTEYLGARIRRIGADGFVSTVAGSGQTGVTPDGGKAVSAAIVLSRGVAQDTSGNVYFTEEGNFKVRKVSPAGTITTAAGNGLPGSLPVNGVAANTTALGFPYAVTLDASGNLYFPDGAQHVIRKVSPAGIISTVAGNGTAGFSGDNGPALGARLNGPSGVAVDDAGNIYIADVGNLRVRKVSTAGVITTIAGNGRAEYSGEGGPAAKASLSPGAITLDAAGNIFVADANNHRVVKITTAGIINTVAGTGQAGSAGDGGPATLASLAAPGGVAVDSKGNIYIADTGNGRVRVVRVAPATFTVSTNALSFSGKATGAATGAQTVQITGSTPGLPFAAGISTGDGGAWLQTSLQKGTMPYALLISADPGKLQPGTYQGTVTVTAQGAQPAAQTIAIVLTVTVADAPSLSVKTDALSFSLLQGQGGASRTLTVANTGGGSIAVTAAASTASGGKWLSVTPAQATVSASAPGNLTIAVDPAGLEPGTYLGQFTISGSTGQNVVVPATLVVSPVRQKLLLTSSGFTFQAVAGGGIVPPQNFGIANAGNGVLNWTATPGPSWLTLSSASGASAAGGAIPQVVLNVIAASLAPGTYYDKVTISAPQADNAPQIVSAVLNVLPASAGAGPVVQPAGLVFTATEGGVSPGSQTVTLYNIGTTPLNFNSNRLTLDGGNWFVHLPSTGTVAPQSPIPIVVQPNVSGLGAGIYSGVITLIFPNQVVQNVNLLFVVTPAATTATGAVTSIRTQGAVRLDSGGCAPTKLAPLFTSFASGFTGPVGWPVPIAVQIVDDCGTPLTSGSVAVTFTNGDAPLALTSTGAGLWSGTWTPRLAQSSNVTVTARAQSQTGLTGQIQVSGQTQPNVGVPLLRPSAIVNSAYPASPVPLAPGSLVSLFGSSLATSQQTARGFPLPAELGGVAVIMAGRELPILYTAEGQVNTLIPYDMAFNTSQQLVVQAGGRLTSPELVPIAAAQPVIFTANGSGGQGLIFLTSGGARTLADGQNPAAAGDEILIEASGLGAVTPTFDSRAVPAAPLPQTVNAVSVTIAGLAAQVESAGLSPDVPGLYYVRAIVPGGVTAGNAVPVVLSAAGASSPTASMAIR